MSRADYGSMEKQVNHQGATIKARQRGGRHTDRPAVENVEMALILA
jgi:hypothetical protein